MSEITEILLERRGGGKPHKLIQQQDKEYVFSVAENWMPIYITGEMDNIAAIDSDGGPMIRVGDSVDGKVVEKIYFKDDVGFIVKFE